MNQNLCDNCPNRTTGKPEDCCQNLPATAFEEQQFDKEAKRLSKLGRLKIAEIVCKKPVDKDDRYEKIRETHMKMTGMFGNLVQPTVYGWA